jgi:hypothetical protein
VTGRPTGRVGTRTWPNRPERTADERAEPDARERMRRAYDDGRAAALRGEEAAPGCTVTPEGKAFLAGYVAGARARRDGG